VWGGRGAKLIIHLVVPKLGMGGALPPLQLYAFMTCTPTIHIATVP